MDKNNSVIFAFSVDHASRLTGLSNWQLASWDRAGFFKPEHASENRKEPYSRIYSFRAIVGLRTLAVLRSKDHRVPMWHLKEVAADLDRHVERPWSETTLYVLNRRVYFDEPGTGLKREVSGPQYSLLPLQSIASEVAREVEKLRERPSDKIGMVERHGNVAHNALVIAGTRIPVRTIQEFADAGYSMEGIIKEYPTLTEADVKKALALAA
jgi:uncharacterized protein (DUF433 family)